MYKWIRNTRKWVWKGSRWKTCCLVCSGFLSLCLFLLFTNILGWGGPLKLPWGKYSSYWLIEEYWISRYITSTWLVLLWRPWFLRTGASLGSLAPQPNQSARPLASLPPSTNSTRPPCSTSSLLVLIPLPIAPTTTKPKTKICSRVIFWNWLVGCQNFWCLFVSMIFKVDVIYSRLMLWI